MSGAVRFQAESCGASTAKAQRPPKRWKFLKELAPSVINPRRVEDVRDPKSGENGKSEGQERRADALGFSKKAPHRPALFEGGGDPARDGVWIGGGYVLPVGGKIAPGEANKPERDCGGAVDADSELRTNLRSAIDSSVDPHCLCCVRAPFRFMSSPLG